MWRRLAAAASSTLVNTLCRITERSLLIGLSRRTYSAGLYAQHRLALRRGQGVVDRLLKAGAGQQVADALLEFEGRISSLRRQAVSQQRGRQTVVAVQPGEVFDQVGRPLLDVESVRRRRHVAAHPVPAAPPEIPAP